MSDVDHVLKAFDTFSARELEQFVQAFAEDVVWYPFFAGIEGEVYRGHEGIRAVVANVDSSWEDFEVLREEVIELQDGVLVLGEFAGTGRETGIRMSNPGGWLFRLEAGLITEVRTFGDHGEARRAAGL